MIISEIFYGVKCDRCDEVFEDNDSSFWSDESSATEYATESEWLERGHKHYCPNCQKIDEETDEVVILEPYPKELKTLIQFIKKIVKKNTTVFEFESHFLIKFHLYNQLKLESFEVDYIKSLLGEKFISLEYEDVKYNGLICCLSISK